MGIQILVNQSSMFRIYISKLNSLFNLKYDDKLIRLSYVDSNKDASTTNDKHRSICLIAFYQLILPSVTCLYIQLQLI